MGLDNPLHLAFLVLLLLLVFGAKRLPEMGRSLGAGMRGFRESITGETSAPSSLAPPAGTLPTETVRTADRDGARTADREGARTADRDGARTSSEPAPDGRVTALR